MKGLVIAAHRRHYDVALPDGERIECLLKGRSLRIAVGDNVTVEVDPGGMTRAAPTPGGARGSREGAVVTGVEPRRNLVYRSDAFKEKLLAANVTQVAAVVAPDVAVDEELLNRWMIAAEAVQCRYLILANKQDLPSFPHLRTRLAPYEALGYRVVPMSARQDIAEARTCLEGQHTVLVGQSGMGKSTLINALLPDAQAPTAQVSEALNAGRHTTTSSTLYMLDGDSWIVDSPGVKVFGLAHVAADDLPGAFVEMRPYLGHCRFRNCRHDAEPDCAVRQAVASGKIAPSRLSLLHALLREVESKDGMRSR